MALQYASFRLHLIKHSKKLSSTFSPQLPLKHQVQNFPELLHSLNIPFTLPIRPKQIGIRNLFCNPQLRISIYHIPNEKIMKLHSHPKMNVLTYIIHGEMEALLFNHSTDKPQLFTKETVVLSKGMKNYTQPKSNNLHQFKGREHGCSFLDIIFPDYNNTDRPCQHFNYKQESTINGTQLYELTKLGDDYFDEMQLM